MSQSQRLQGKRALVTGGGTGIGQGIAREFALAGAAVAVHYAHSSQGAEEVVRAIQAAGGRAAAFGADFNDLGAVARLADEATSFLGGLDVLVNNSGITLNVPFDRATPEQFDTLYNVNVRAAYFLIQYGLGELVKNKGAVVNITSIHAFEGMPEHSIYAGTKGAIVAYTRALAIELAPRGVRVNAIAPGCVPVANYEKAIGKYDTEAMGHGIPTGYVGTAEDIGKAAVFLASEDARFIIGQTLVVDGGTTSWMPFGDQFRQPIADSGVQFGKGYVPGV